MYVKTRNELAEYFNELGFKTGAEIGVNRGFYSRQLCRSIPDLKLYCVDPWVIKIPRHEEKYQEALTMLSPFDTHIIRKTSMEAVKDFEDESLDFVYIDGDHSYQAVKDDLREWSKKVRKGGIISGHDYQWCGVKPAVDEHMEGRPFSVTERDDRGITFWYIK